MTDDGIMVLVLVIQIVAAVGAFVFGRFAERAG